MKPLAFFLRKNAVGLSQYLAILLSPRGVSPRREENDFRPFSEESRMKPFATAPAASHCWFHREGIK